MSLKILTKNKSMLIIGLCFLFMFVISNIISNNFTNSPKKIKGYTTVNDEPDSKLKTSSLVTSGLTVNEGNQRCTMEQI